MQPEAIPYPCCGRQTHRPSARVIALALDLSPYQAIILETIMAGRGEPVPVSRIIAAMYSGDDTKRSDDPCLAFKVPLSKMRPRLARLGLLVESAGYGVGYVARWIE